MTNFLHFPTTFKSVLNSNMFLKFLVFNVGFIVKHITRKVMVTEAATISVL